LLLHSLDYAVSLLKKDAKVDNAALFGVIAVLLRISAALVLDNVNAIAMVASLAFLLALTTRLLLI